MNVKELITSYSYPRPTTAEDRTQLVADSLEVVNAVRLALAIGEGKLPALPRGVLRDPEQCVLARALSNGWSAMINCGVIALRNANADADAAADALRTLGFQVCDVYEDVVEVMLPQVLAALVTEFDFEKLPELILGKEETT